MSASELEQLCVISAVTPLHAEATSFQGEPQLHITLLPRQAVLLLSAEEASP